MGEKSPNFLKVSEIISLFELGSSSFESFKFLKLEEIEELDLNDGDKFL